MKSFLYNLAEEDPEVYSSFQDMPCGWSPRREWPDRPLASGAPPQPVPSASAVGASTPEVQKQLFMSYKKQGQLLQRLGVGTQQDLPHSSEKSVIPIGMDSKFCPICERKFTSNYVAVLHYKYQHLHATKWQCQYCNSYLTSQANLDKKYPDNTSRPKLYMSVMF